MINRKAVRPVVSRGFPTVGIMAFDAVLAEFTLMLIVCLMAAITGIGGAFEYLVHMAGRTIHRQVFPG